MYKNLTAVSVELYKYFQVVSLSYLDIFLFSNSLSPQDHICLTFLFYNIHNTVYIIYILTIADYLQKAKILHSLALLIFKPVWRIQNVLMRIRIPLFELMRIRIQTFFSYGENFFSNLHFFFSIILQNLSCVIFSVTMREEGLGFRDKV